jgi:hypothetical protein
MGLIGGAVLASVVPPAAADSAGIKVTLSYGCQDKTLCGSSLLGVGGIRGWLEAEGNGSADGHLLAQFHSSGPVLDVTYQSTGVSGYTSVFCPPGSTAPDCFLVNLESPPPDPNYNYFEFFVQFPDGSAPVVTPATPGHYGVHSAPGVFKEITVTALP